MFKIATFLIMVLWSWPSPVLAALIDVEAGAKQETITLNLERADGYKAFTLVNPPRLVVDVPRQAVDHARLPSSYDGKRLKQVRFGHFSADISRFVFDLRTPVKIVKASEAGDALIITIVALKETSALATAPKKKTKPVVVIDAGHGGVDPGARGPKGTLEKDVVLQYAQALQSRLIRTGRYKVMLTREGDRFIMLRKRVEMARKADGAIFISLHADSAPSRDARGLSVYTVSEQASDAEAEALAAKENKADVIAGMDLSSERDDVAGILISLAQRETKNNSALLADLLVTHLNDKVRLLENTHRFAGFAVLKAPDIPSVLIEIGFLSHPEEEKLLKSKTYRDKVIAGIMSGIDAYFEQREP